MTSPETIDEDGALQPAHVLYRFYDADDRLLYIGMTSNFPVRYQSHRRDTPWFSDVARCTKEYLATRDDLVAAERVAIQSEGAKHNVVHAPPKPEPIRHPERRIGRDANDFGRTDGIACDGTPPGQREDRIKELERYVFAQPTILDDHCPSCNSVYLIEHDDMVRCLYCFSNWTLDEFALARLEESA